MELNFSAGLDALGLGWEQRIGPEDLPPPIRITSSGKHAEAMRADMGPPSAAWLGDSVNAV